MLAFKCILLAQGIRPMEAEARVDGLPDAEVMCLAEQIEQVPAGGIDVVSIVLIACLIICVGAFIIGVIDVL